MTPADFSYTVREGPGVHVVALHGELDLASSDALAAVLFEIAGSTLVLDFSDLTFLDSRGVAALEDARDRIAAAGKGEMVLTRAHGMVERVLEMVRLGDMVRDWSEDWDLEKS